MRFTLAIIVQVHSNISTVERAQSLQVNLLTDVLQLLKSVVIKFVQTIPIKSLISESLELTKNQKLTSVYLGGRSLPLEIKKLICSARFTRPKTAEDFQT